MSDLIERLKDRFTAIELRVGIWEELRRPQWDILRTDYQAAIAALRDMRDEIDELSEESICKDVTITDLARQLERDKVIRDEAFQALCEEGLQMQQRIEELEAELAKHQESSFHPDWSMLEATRDSLREHQTEIKRLDAALAEIENLDCTAHLDGDWETPFLDVIEITRKARAGE